MSLIYTIMTRSMQDLINEGDKLVLTGTFGAGTDHVIQAAAADRAFIITGFSLTTNNGTPFLASLGFKLGTTSTQVFHNGYIGSSMPIIRDYALGAWVNGGIGYNLVLTTAGTVYYTINMRSTAIKAGINYVEQDNATGHGGAWFPGEARRVGFE